MTGINPILLMQGMSAAAIEAVSPQNTIPKALATLERTSGRTLVMCIGKAAAQMAQIAEGILLDTIGADNFSGYVVTKHGNEAPLKRLKTITAGHPRADLDSAAAAELLLKEAGTLGPNDRLLVLMSGGASALTLLPADGLTFDDVTVVNDELLRGGVPIDGMNTLRRHVSRFNGGRLARAANGADIITFAVSDVPGDRPEIIGSGPTAPDATTFADAKKVVNDYGLSMPQNVTDHLAVASDESVKPSDPIWRSKYRFEVIASNRHALNAAAEYARQQGVTPIIMDEVIAGDAAAEAQQFANIARTRTYKGQIIQGPAVLLRGGEAVVKLPKDFSGPNSNQRGGRIGHAAMSYLIHDPDNFAGFVATDGSDGTSGHSAIFLTPNTMQEAVKQGLDPLASLTQFNSAAFFDAVAASVPERPTGTNVNEIYISYIPV